MSKYLYRCLQNYDSADLDDVGAEFDKSKNAISLSPQRIPKELVSATNCQNTFEKSLNI